MHSLRQTCTSIFRGGSRLSNGMSTTHHQSLTDLERSAGQGCFICTILAAEILSRRQITKANSHSEDSRSQYPVSVYGIQPDRRYPEVLEITISFNEKGYKTGGGYRLFGLQPLQETQLQPLAGAPTNSPQTTFDMKYARMWLRDCEGHHNNCCVQGSLRQGPSRLIQIDRPGCDQVRLVDAATISGDRIRYATLSHCWGSSTVFKLTSATKTKLNQGISTLELGLTFRDAVKVAREIGVFLIWIDALCIIQDSKDDWKKEAAKMSDVYRGAIVNIAAMSGVNTEAGCLPENFQHEVEPFIVTMQRTGLPSGKYILFDHMYATNRFEHMALLERAWVVQELIFAPRILYLCATEMFWLCHEVIASETYPDRIPPMRFKPWIPRNTIWNAMYRPHITEQPGSDASKQLLWGLWREIIEVYTKCSLTFASDKLVAVSGLAKSIQAAFNIDYCAGLWDCDLEY
ncbi:hypothetical protein QQS21_003611 [Conoideocrella luteorostrata]|uniref:Heterokaryon incompatibility domain-containing protein n=1 Tax=Conoideocrella luteorostrata TaxID=1105319 RepID=A0AAJ0CT16_9HYPO|nr:hypothetical protein QQS21_003611 [Conoideocrella luteorostrata]